jgi:hypothetical protein
MEKIIFVKLDDGDQLKVVEIITGFDLPTTDQGVWEMYYMNRDEDPTTDLRYIRLGNNEISKDIELSIGPELRELALVCPDVETTGVWGNIKATVWPAYQGEVKFITHWVSDGIHCYRFTTPDR